MDLKKAAWLANLLVAVVLISVISGQIYRDRGRVIEASYRDLEKVTAVLAEHTQQTLGALDLALITVAFQVYQQSIGNSINVDAIYQVLQNRQAASTSTYAFFVLDAQGQLVATSRTPTPDPADLSQRPEFLIQQNGNHQGLYIAYPRRGLIGLAEGQWIINLSRRIPAADGSLLGVASLSLSIDSLLAFYEALRPGEQSAVGILSTEGVVIARSPFDETLLGSDVSQNSLFLNREAVSEQGGRVSDVFLVEEVTRLSAYRYVWDNQLIVYANIAEAEVLLPWVEDLQFRVGIGLLIMLLFGSATLATVYYVQRRQLWVERTLVTQQVALAQVTAAKAEIETIFTSISDAVFSLDKDWRFAFLNAEAERLLNKSADELLGKCIWDEFPEAKGTQWQIQYEKASTENVVVTFEQYYPLPLRRWLSVRAFPHKDGLTVYFHDITHDKDMEERLRQSQKMDALGQLTGGVAHDFNNLLTVIMGNADLLADHLKTAPAAIRSQADIILKAGERAAELTQRLLAFARRQPLDPCQTDANDLINDVGQMLRRTLGEAVSIELVRAAGLWKAIVDPNGLQNAILNLALNARDSMPEGGKLTIETANVSVDSDYADDHEIQPGRYVMIAVSDTGCGMTPEIVARAFDPFFTTKTEGKGSGLGLSMVYGFARQSGGHAKIYSEPDEGTTIKLYLPRANVGEDPDYQQLEGTPQIIGGSEHILLVEDNDMVRLHAVNSLRSLGYKVTECADGATALTHLQSSTRFDLLLTDVVLAGGMSGKQVADQATKLAPETKQLYMSGYTENAIVHHGRLDRGVHLLSKPFRLTDLARKVRDVLGG